MITIIITSILGLAIAFYLTNKQDTIWRKDKWDYVLPLFLGSLLVGMMLGLMISLVIPSKHEMVITDTLELESFQDNSSISGSFFLGSGYINGTMKYTFYYKVDDGFKMKQLNHQDVVLKYTEENPRVEEYQKRLTDDIINLFSIIDGCDKSYVVYVPKGTIKQNYILDAK